MRHYTPRMPSPPVSTVNLLPQVPAVQHNKERDREGELRGRLKEDDLDSDFKPEGAVEGGQWGVRIEGTEVERNSERKEQGSGSPEGRNSRKTPAPVTPPIENLTSTPLVHVGFEQERLTSENKAEHASLEDEGKGHQLLTPERVEEAEGEEGRDSDDGMGREEGREVGIEEEEGKGSDHEEGGEGNEGEGEGGEGQEMDSIPEEGTSCVLTYNIYRAVFYTQEQNGMWTRLTLKRYRRRKRAGQKSLRLKKTRKRQR